MSASVPPRDEPFWRWAPGDPDRAVLTSGTGSRTAAGLDATAARLAAALGTGALLVAGTDVVTAATAWLAAARAGAPLVVSRETGQEHLAALAERHGVTAALVPPGTTLPQGVRAPGAAGPGAATAPTAPTADAEAVATAHAVVADVVGIPYDARVAFALPHLDPAGLGLLGGLLHARRHVVAPDGWDGGETALVASRRGCERAVARLRGLGAALARVVVVGRVADDGLRGRVAATLGADVLVEHGADEDGHATVVVPPGPLAGVWSALAAGPSEVAVEVVGGRTVTRGELAATVTALAGRLRDAVPEGGTGIAFLADPADVLAALLAAAAAGVHLAVREPADAEAALRAAAAAGAGVVVVEDAVRWPAGTGMPAVGLTGGAPDADPLRLATRGAAGGLLPRTSGTTGAARYVHPARRPVTSALVGAYARVTAARLGIVGDGAHLAPSGIREGAPLTMALLALHAGQSVVVLPEWSPSDALASLYRADVTSAFVVPSMLSSLLALRAGRPGRPPALRALVHAAAPCPIDVKRAVLDWFGPIVYEHYSASEGVATYVRPEEWLSRPGTVGRPFAGAAVRVIDEDGAECPPGVVGDVYLSDTGFRYGDGSEPYGRRPGAVALGDRGLLDDDGWLHLRGRTSEYVNVGGAKFHPAEVEEVLRRHPGVADCGVRGIAHSRLGEVVAAYVVPVAGADQAAVRRALLATARQELPVYQVPMRLVFVERLPRDGHGKLRRRDLPVAP